MKRILAILCGGLLLVAVGCRKHVSDECLQAKVIRITCASTVFQVFNNNAIGQDGWLDIYDNNRSYDNVFAVSNVCRLASEHQVGNVVYVTTAKAGKNDCVRCELYDAAPKISYEVKTIGNLPCCDASK